MSGSSRLLLILFSYRCISVLEDGCAELYLQQGLDARYFEQYLASDASLPIPAVLHWRRFETRIKSSSLYHEGTPSTPISLDVARHNVLLTSLIISHKMPSPNEFVTGVNSNAYRNRISRPHYSDQELQDNIYQKRREINAAGWSIGAGLALIPFTTGASAIALPIPARVIQIAHKKLVLLEEEWNRRGYQALPTRIFRDGVIPCAIAGTVGAVGMGVDYGFSAAGSAAVNHAAIAGGGHLAANTIQAHAVAPGAGHQFWNGTENGVQQTFGFLGHPTNGYIAPAMPYSAPAYAVGQAVGMNGVHQFVNYTTQRVGDWAQDQLVGRRR